MQRTYSGAESGPGAVYAKATNLTSFAIRPAGAGSHVTWSLTGQKTLMTKVMGLVKSMDSLIGPDFEKGLSRLKAVVEHPAAG